MPVVGVINAVDGHNAIGATRQVGAEAQRARRRGDVAAGLQIGGIRRVELGLQFTILIQAEAQIETGHLRGVVKEAVGHGHLETARVGRACGDGIFQREPRGSERQCASIGSARFQPDGHGLVIDVAIGTHRTADALCRGVEHTQHEVTVALAGPAPVDVEQAVGIHAIAHKGVPARLLVAGIGHRTAGGQLVVEHLLPVLGAIVQATHIACTGLVAKVGRQGIGDECRRRIRHRLLEIHRQSLVAVFHQCGYGLGGGAGGVVAVIEVVHGRPVEIHRAERRHEDGIAR